MKLEEYLAAEGIKQMPEDKTKGIVTKTLTAKEYDELEGYRYLLYEVGPNPVMQKIHTLYIKHNLANILHCAECINIRKEMPMVLENLPTNARILDIGCYDGLKAVYYKLVRPDLEIVAIDHCKAAVKLAKQKAAKYGADVDFKYGEFTQFKPGEQFDAVVATRVFQEQATMTFDGEQIIPWEDCAQKSNELLTPEGKLLVSLSISKTYKGATKRHVQSGMKQCGMRQILEKSWKNYCNSDAIIYFLVFKK
jgi:precorrin-6B methylase 2